MKSVCDYDKPNNEYVLDREVKIANGIFFISIPNYPKGINQMFKNSIVSHFGTHI